MCQSKSKKISSGSLVGFIWEGGLVLGLLQISVNFLNGQLFLWPSPVNNSSVNTGHCGIFFPRLWRLVGACSN